MKNKKICLIAVLVALALLGVVLAQLSQYQTVSNVVQGQTVVSPSQPLTITPDPGAPGGGSMPKTMSTGQPTTIWLDVNNPNTATVNGWIMVNFTTDAPNITYSDVLLSSGSPFLLTVTPLGIYNDNTLAYQVQLSTITGLTDLRFDPGYRANFTCLTIQYNRPATYNYAIAICQ